MSRQIERELRQVAGIHAKCIVRTVERAVEKLLPIANNKVARLGSVAKRASSIVG